MLYENSDPSAIVMATLYLMGGTKSSSGHLEFCFQSLQQIFKQQDVIDVTLAMPNSQSVKVHLLVLFAKRLALIILDPLGGVTPQNILDWDEIDSSRYPNYDS